MTVEWIHRLLNIYRDKMTDPTRSIFLTDTDQVSQDCYDMIVRCERLRTSFIDTRRLYEAATGDLRNIMNDIDRGVTSLTAAGGGAGGGVGGVGGEGTTFSVETPSSSSSPSSFGDGSALSRTALRGQVDRLDAMIDRLDGFEVRNVNFRVF